MLIDLFGLLSLIVLFSFTIFQCGTAVLSIPNVQSFGEVAGAVEIAGTGCRKGCAGRWR